jgi:hypothetical protein
VHLQSSLTCVSSLAERSMGFTLADQTSMLRKRKICSVWCVCARVMCCVVLHCVALCVLRVLCCCCVSCCIV